MQKGRKGVRERKKFQIFQIFRPSLGKNSANKGKKKEVEGKFSPPYRQETPRAPCRARLRARCKKAEYESTLVSLQGASLTTFREGKKSHFGQMGTESPTIARGGTESHFGQMGRKSHYLPRGARSLIVSRAHLRSLYSTRARNKSRAYIIGAQDYRPQKWPKVSADGERGKSLGLWRWARSPTMGKKGQKSHSMPKGCRVSADARGARVSHGRRAPTHGRAEDGR